MAGSDKTRCYPRCVFQRVFSVDRWDDKWPEATKRAVIRDAYF
ncbi:phage tail protein I, partial [Salmonella enterica subsp. enterica serovar Give]|nr:phage tail protein I [Salmonella enterica subsp. enterica serovar Give]